MRSILQTYLQDKTAFYAYKHPADNQVHIDTIGKTARFDFNKLAEEKDSDAFVIFPFESSDEKGGWYFTSEKQLVFQTPSKDATLSLPEPNTSQHFNEKQFEEYGKQFDKMMEGIKSNRVQKVILSKSIQIKKSLENELPDIFVKLMSLYPKTFVFLISSPKTGVWMGASPELLFSKEDQKCTTVSLAGTRSKHDDISSWTNKEIEEQSMVSDFIDNALEKHNIERYERSGPSMLKVGNLTHLKTIYQFNAPSDFHWGEFVKTLHPTPALCGEPQSKAMELIREVETHGREYYGGFLGPISQNSIHLYVNLRSMKIEKNESTIYIGGGLTNQSNLKNEWKELKLKSKTLLSAIQTKTQHFSQTINNE